MIEAALERLTLMVPPKGAILCAGQDQQRLHAALHARYPDAHFLNETDMIPSSADWVVAHFALPFAENPLEALWRWRACLKPGGMLFCTHFGPDTLIEWHHAAERILPKRLDMHELGDLMLHAGFCDPVIDVDYYHTRHRAIQHYLDELTITHMIQPGTLASEIDNEQKEWMTTYEIVFAHGFAKESLSTQDDTGTVVKIPVSHIGKIARSS